MVKFRCFPQDVTSVNDVYTYQFSCKLSLLALSKYGFKRSVSC